MTEAFSYTGELSLFEHAVRWKAYWKRAVSPHLGARVLDVGAGIGSTARLLCHEGIEDWLCLEPDPALVARMSALGLPQPCRTRVGATDGLDQDELFDTILYMDVLEHIEDDRAELARAATHLRPGGRIVVLAPAHRYLFTPFDAAVGHFRRYDRASLTACGPPDLRLHALRYLDSVGMLASGANRLLLKAGTPTVGQILLWDRVMVPLSRLLDPLLGWRLGKSVIAVWSA